MKPGRNDLPKNKLSLCLSCSDKLALYNLIGIQGKQLFKYIKPVYINLFVIKTDKSSEENIRNGIDFVYRLSMLKNKDNGLIKRKIFNILLDNK